MVNNITRENRSVFLFSRPIGVPCSKGKPKAFAGTGHHSGMNGKIVLVLPLLAATGLAQPQPQPGSGVNFYRIEKETGLGRLLAKDFRERNHMMESPLALDYISRIGQRLATE